MANIYDMTDTWNAGGTTYTGIKMNVTDTASAAGSLLLDLQVGGASKFKVTKGGQLITAAGMSEQGDPYVKIYFPDYLTVGFWYNGGLNAKVEANNGSWVTLTTSGTIGYSDVMFSRDAANVFAQKNTTNAQTHRIYGTYTDASNYRRVAIGVTTGGVASITPEGAGTGASGNVLHISGLPTANPGPGILWNNAGTPAIGT